ncbi:putative receptor-like protein kinase [Platanthera zijinensis]|uniref:Receptor-like protein kinase n=1 Tax=Platanthera zijinensis TaxID=2320716 RepID=A0AAP0AY48_9ASPA
MASVRIMASNGILVVVIFSVLFTSAEAQARPLFINCGANASTIVDGRKWTADSVPPNNFTLSYPGQIISTSANNGDPVYGDLYKTARVFNTTSMYSFSMARGTFCMIRLHFCPLSSENFNVNGSLFDVKANNLKLVSKFDVVEEISWRNRKNSSKFSSLMKEFFLDTGLNNLSIQFIPNHEGFAFVSAIEVIPVLGKLFADPANRLGGNELSLTGRGMETMYRLNMGGPKLDSGKDPNLWTSWDTDENYMFSLNTSSTVSNTSAISYASSNESSFAPLMVYESARVSSDSRVLERRFNMSWSFDVDPSFDYLIRLHFCELTYDIANQRIFRIFINKKTAAANYDVFEHAKGRNLAYHEDYVDYLSSQGDTLWLQLGSDPSSGDSDAILNGLEIFKLSQNDNLAHALSRIDTGIQEESGKKPKIKSFWIAISSSVGILMLFMLSSTAFIFLHIRRRKKKKKINGQHNSNPPGWRPLFLHGAVESITNPQASKAAPKFNGSLGSNRPGKMFTFHEIKLATNNFNESLVIGVGGFGKVFKGIVGGMAVAIKRAHPQSQQGLKEFETEIEMLSKLRHRHLVSMIGYCDEQNEMILVYEYMAEGTLRSHLFGSDKPPLAWRRRLEICIGAARGLHYLHTGADRSIIHRDVKTTNILLDQNFVAKVADFGLSKAGPALDQTHVSTAVKGSFGYLDPEYFRREQLTQKSDVYSFGVVLFEVICARAVINPALPKEQVNLAEWALRWQRRKSLEAVVDRQLEGKCSADSLRKFGEIAEKCLADDCRSRPTMGEVLWHLESLLQSHEEHGVRVGLRPEGEEEDDSGLLSSHHKPEES